MPFLQYACQPAAGGGEPAVGPLTLPVEEAACTARSRVLFSIDFRACSSGQITLNAQLAYWTNKVFARTPP